MYRQTNASHMPSRQIKEVKEEEEEIEEIEEIFTEGTTIPVYTVVEEDVENDLVIIKVYTKNKRAKILFFVSRDTSSCLSRIARV